MDDLPPQKSHWSITRVVSHPNDSWVVHHQVPIWRFPKTRATPIFILHFERWEFPFTKAPSSELGVPPWLWKPPYRNWSPSSRLADRNEKVLIHPMGAKELLRVSQQRNFQCYYGGYTDITDWYIAVIYRLGNIWVFFKTLEIISYLVIQGSLDWLYLIVTCRVEI